MKKEEKKIRQQRTFHTKTSRRTKKRPLEKNNNVALFYSFTGKCRLREDKKKKHPEHDFFNPTTSSSSPTPQRPYFEDWLAKNKSFRYIFHT